MLENKVVLQGICILLLIIGEVLIIITTMLYKKLLKKNQEATYTPFITDKKQQYILLGLLYTFVLGYLVGIVNILLRETTFTTVYFSVVFFLGSCSLYFIINSLLGMEKMLQKKNIEIMKTFVNSIDLKDRYTKGHSMHVYAIIKVFYDYLPEKYKKQLNRSKLLDAAMLHDIGKISISDKLLNKMDELTPEEWDTIKKHPWEGKRMLDDTCFREISDWVLCHHERMDGKGYYSIKADKIPLESRIITIADTYSAICTHRTYRSRMPHNSALAIMNNERGTQFDEELLDCFSSIPSQEIVRLFDTMGE